MFFFKLEKKSQTLKNAIFLFTLLLPVGLNESDNGQFQGISELLAKYYISYTIIYKPSEITCNRKRESKIITFHMTHKLNLLILRSLRQGKRQNTL